MKGGKEGCVCGNELYLKEALVGLCLSASSLREEPGSDLSHSKPSEVRSGFQEDPPDIVTLKFASCIWGLMLDSHFGKLKSTLGWGLPLSQEIWKVKRKKVYLFGRRI